MNPVLPQLNLREMNGHQSQRGISPLELLHPKGFATCALVVGTNCPAVLLPHNVVDDIAGADLIVVAPTSSECRTTGWLEDAAYSTAQRLAPDGIAYVLVPVIWRRRFKRLLEKQGLSIGLHNAHIPNWIQSTYLVPTSQQAMSFAATQLVRMKLWKQWAALTILSLPGGKALIDTVAPYVGFVVQHPVDANNCTWLFEQNGEVGQQNNIIIRPSWRGQTGAIVLYQFTGASQPSAIAKVTPETATAQNSITEAAKLVRVGRIAAQAGVQVPQPLAVSCVGRASVVFQSVVSGQSVATLLATQPDLLPELTKRLADWLEHWNRLTAKIQPVSPEQLERALIMPATLVAPFLANGEAYVAWLNDRCKAIANFHMPFVATHNDLTVANVLLDAQGNIGIIDWETAQTQGFPLVDFFYMMTDAVAAAQQSSWPMAFQLCLTPGTTYNDHMTRLQLDLRHAMSMQSEIIDLCLHACWLHHAVNEYHASGVATTRPALEIVSWLATHRFRIQEMLCNGTI